MFYIGYFANQLIKSQTENTKCCRITFVVCVLFHTGSRFIRQHMAMDVLCIDGHFGCIFCHEPNSWCAERVYFCIYFLFYYLRFIKFEK